MSANAILIALRNLVESSDGVMAGTWFHDSLDKAKEAIEAIEVNPAPPERKIVQITDVEGWLIALCNDGTVWKLYAENEWASLPPIPQGEST